MAKIAEQVIVYDGSKTADKSSATFQDVCVLPSGRILVSWRGGPQKGPINMGENGYYCISDDSGKTWTEPKAPFGSLKIWHRIWNLQDLLWKSSSSFARSIT